MNPTEALASYVSETKFSDFPPDIVLKAKYCILDSIGCALGGVQTDIGKQHVKIAGIMGGDPEATLVGDGARVAMANAAYANGQIANVLDYDDAVIPVPGHPGIAIIYPALAAGERVGAPGKDVITAVILGYEVGLRVAHALRSVVMPAGAKHPYLLFNTSYKIFGAATAAGKVLGLDRDGIVASFGTAGLVVPGTSQHTWAPGSLEKAMIKSNYGIYAFLGTFAALQAEQGMVGPKDILDGDEFWTKTGANNCNYFELTRGLGSDYFITEIGFKPVPSCRGTHPQLTAVMEALKGKGVESGDIEEIVLYGGRMLTRPKWDTMLEAEFSTACAVALYLSGAEPGPDWYLHGRYKDKDILGLAKKIKFVEELKYWEIWVKYGKLAAAAEIKTKDGKIRKAYIEYPKGEPQNPLTEAEHRKKFVGNCDAVIGKKQTEKLYQTIMHLENTSVVELMRMTSRQ
jgi:2-methylcitrate dehydratase PrpD